MSGCCQVEGPPAAPFSSGFHPGPRSAGTCRAQNILTAPSAGELKKKNPKNNQQSSFPLTCELPVSVSNSTVGGRIGNGIFIYNFIYQNPTTYETYEKP